MLTGMTSTRTSPDLGCTLQRSAELDAAASAILQSQGYRLFEDSAALVCSFNAGEVALEHARAVRALMTDGFHTTAASVMRLQFEAVVRAMWLLWAAPESDLQKLVAPLTPDAEAAAQKLPMVSEMIRALKVKGDPSAYGMVENFKAAMLPALNSHVHSGIHALHRNSAGYPEHLLVQIVQSSNALLTMTTMLLANLTGNREVMQAMRQIQPQFADCLPEALA